MKNIISFEDIKSSYLDIMRNTSSDNQDGYNLDNENDLDDIFYRDICELRDATKLLKHAINVNDHVTIQAALVYIRVCSMRLSGFFEDIKDDADSLLKSAMWPDIPKNYQIPDHYNFPPK